MPNPDVCSRPPAVPLSCDAADLTASGPSWLVWLADDRDVVVVRSAPTFAAAVTAGRAYRAAWNGRVLGVEDPAGVPVPDEQWAPLVDTAGPLPYIYTVELRSASAIGRGCVSTLWTTTDLDSAIRHRARLPDHLRRRTLIVSNAPDGASPPRFPVRPNSVEHDDMARTRSDSLCSRVP